jgi:hypothetical protein
MQTGKELYPGKRTSDAPVLMPIVCHTLHPEPSSNTGLAMSSERHSVFVAWQQRRDSQRPARLVEPERSEDWPAKP